MKWRFFEWNYGTRKVKEWKRSGECNKCMECCEVKIRYKFERTKAIGAYAPMGKAVHIESGIWLEASFGRLRLFATSFTIDKTIQETCMYLTKGGCKAQKQKKGMLIPLCAVWPIHPSLVEPFEKCSYTFELLSEEDF